MEGQREERALGKRIISLVCTEWGVDANALLQGGSSLRRNHDVDK